ncbi:peptidoglycan DD-metalloendopeptidase family protein [Tabrizicola sp. DMG-N-6]|uniref:Peptidoglycan DD-metalloendopeptidase family protein n=2 Tax=Szabonella alba TaxID=2804194 RepID=A0A8K0VCG7_9RHOB|nr:peptidoglycan DD-metalloendopeptidase family protein [Szabonella alba]
MTIATATVSGGAASAGAARPARRATGRTILAGISLLALAACSDRPLDWDLRGLTGGGLDTSGAAIQATEARPRPDDRGVISYPGYQVVLARRGDTPRSVAARIGMGADELARHNAVLPDDLLRDGEVLALPRRIEGGAAPLGVTGSGSGQIASGTIAPSPVDVSTIATTALDRVGSGTTTTPPAASGNAAQTATQPGRHRVARGETAYSIARLYNVNVRALADWNGLGADLALREGQYLLIPTASAPPARSAQATTTAPGQGTPTPVPPSATTPLPAERTTPAAEASSGTPASPNMGAQRTTGSNARFAMPVDGRIIREYAKGRNEGIDIGAAAGAPVRAAADGVVAAITRDTNQVPIMVIRHSDNLLTVYAGIDGLTVAKDATVKRGQTIAVVRQANPAFLHFEVRRGVDSVDPMTMLQ